MTVPLETFLASVWVPSIPEAGDLWSMSVNVPELASLTSEVAPLEAGVDEHGPRRQPTEARPLIARLAKQLSFGDQDP